MDAQKVLQHHEFLQNAETLRYALSSILAKQPEDKEAFNFCFDLFFLGETRKRSFLDEKSQIDELQTQINASDTFNDETPTSDAMGAGSFEGAIGSGMSGSTMPQQTTSPEALPHSLVAQEFLRWISDQNMSLAMQLIENPNQIGQIIAQNLRRKSMDPKVIGKRLRELEADLNRALVMVQQNELTGSRPNKELIEALRSNIEQAIKQAKLQIVRLETSNKEEMLSAFFWTDEERANVLDQSFRKIRSHIDEVSLQLTRLGRKLASKERRRRRLEKKGRIDFRRTIRANLATGGTPVKLMYRKRRIEDPEIFLLNDVSGSTEWISEWFFVVAYAAQKAFQRIKVFEFDSTTVEVTDALKETDLAKALIKRSLPWKNAFSTGHSNYQSSLKDFLTLTENDLTKKTTIILLGDCRDWQGMWRTTSKYLWPGVPYVPYSADIMASIVKKTKSVIILNPEPPRAWNTGDSVVAYYQAVGAKVFWIDNLRKLTQFVFFPKTKF
ncbi:MAG: VWA domain-containing protein [Promethearchaeota archaeon]